MRDPADIECWLTDMDGVLVHENHEVPGASDLINRWVDTSKRFLVLTNNSIFTPRDLAARMQGSGLTVPEDNIWTSALATAKLLLGVPLYAIVLWITWLLVRSVWSFGMSPSDSSEETR